MPKPRMHTKCTETLRRPFLYDMRAKCITNYQMHAPHLAMLRSVPQTFLLSCFFRFERSHARAKYEYHVHTHTHTPTHTPAPNMQATCTQNMKHAFALHAMCTHFEGIWKVSRPNPTMRTISYTIRTKGIHYECSMPDVHLFRKIHATSYNMNTQCSFKVAMANMRSCRMHTKDTQHACNMHERHLSRVHATCIPNAV